MKKYLIIVIIYSLFLNSANAQQANIWYFGEHAGLDFSTSNPTVLNDGQIATDEGVASICDNTGNLLFYTEGEKIWNRKHSIMPNGNGLNGSFTASQSAIVVPFLNDPARYYVFTVDRFGLLNGFCYSVINMNLDGGLGDVEAKNVQLATPVCEKLTAVKHCNGHDIWVIVHLWQSDAFYAYLITNSGINTSPVISHSGRVLSGNSEITIGCTKTSPDGSKLALANNYIGVDLFDFDNSTGVISNPNFLFNSNELYRNAYGVEFSPDSKLLYVNAFDLDLSDFRDYNNLLQYDVSLPDIVSIRNSKQVIARLNYIYQVYGTLQTGPDGKIYMAEFTFPTLSVINNPNQYGAGCNFSSSAIKLAPGTRSTFGLPSFIQSFWDAGYSFTGACNGLQIQFNYSKPANVSSVQWAFGDPASGINNTSLLENPVHLYATPGKYTVKLIRYSACGNDIVTKEVQVGPLNVGLGKDTTICGDTPYKLNPQTPGSNTYLWQDGSTNQTFSASKSGLYWVEVRSITNGCIKRDSIELIFKPEPKFTLGSDMNKCTGEITSLSANMPGAGYFWNTGETTNTIKVSQSGIYWLDVTLNGCSKRDSVQLTFNPAPIVHLGKDTTLCNDQVLLLNAQNAGAKYLWQNNSTNQMFTVTRPGTYFVDVLLNDCKSSDTIIIQYSPKPSFTLGPDIFICEGMTISLQPKIENSNNGNFLWSNGLTSPSISVTTPGTYSLTMTNSCGISSDEVVIGKGACKLYIPTAFTPNNDGLNDIFKAGFGENITSYNMDVYNRWGEKIFNSKQISKGWDGKINGVAQPHDSYVWLIRYKVMNDSREYLQKGTVTLIR
jgi:gliding motility-associated-like protein